LQRVVRQHTELYHSDVSQLTRSGQDGTLIRAAVLAARDAQNEAPQTTATTEAAHDQDARSGLAIVDRVPMTGVRKMVAEQMVRSRRTIPEATAWLDVDVTELIELRAQLKADNPETAPSLLALIARFTTAALRRYPVMHSRIVENHDGGELVYFDGINLGLPAQTPRGLVVPAIEYAERLSARQHTNDNSELAAKARDGQCTPAELTRGTFTLNNYGVFGTDGAAAIINTPEVAILGVGRIMDRPWVVDGEIMARK